MGKIERLEKLESFFHYAGGKITGRKKLHKVIYLIQELGLDFNQKFIFHYYGVYSPGLSEDLKLAQQWGLIKENVDKHNGAGYSYELVDKSSIHPYEYEKEIKNKIDLLVREKPTVLEVLSTIVFLDRKGYAQEQIAYKVQELKGHLQYCFDDAFKLADDVYGLRIKH